MKVPAFDTQVPGVLPPGLTFATQHPLFRSLAGEGTPFSNEPPQAIDLTSGVSAPPVTEAIPTLGVDPDPVEADTFEEPDA